MPFAIRPLLGLLFFLSIASIAGANALVTSSTTVIQQPKKKAAFGVVFKCKSIYKPC